MSVNLVLKRSKMYHKQIHIYMLPRIIIKALVLKILDELSSTSTTTTYSVLKIALAAAIPLSVLTPEDTHIQE